MLFLVFGSSAAGKTATLNALGGRVSRLAIHDFDEVGVPSGADTAWRHAAVESWLRQALDYQAEGTDLLLAGQTPFGEILAARSAPLLDGSAACLLDCDDGTRLARLEARGPEWLERVGSTLPDFLNWADWMRRHAREPSWRLDVIRRDETEHVMAWERFSAWSAGDPRWRVRVIDTSTARIDDVADQVVQWIAEERVEPAHPLR
jgi:hypothetical protein